MPDHIVRYVAIGLGGGCYGFVLLLGWSICRVSSMCSRIEERRELDYLLEGGEHAAA